MRLWACISSSKMQKKLNRKMETRVIKKPVSWWDWAGVFFSGLCVIHCIVTPLLLASAVVWFASEWVHVSFLVALVPIAIMAARRTYPYSKKRWVIFLFSSGLLLLGLAIVLGESLGEIAEISLTLLGSMLLITGHLQNRHLHVIKKSP